VLSDVVCNGDIVKVDDATVVAIELLVGELDEGDSALVHLSADSTKELVVANLAVVVLVEELEDALELRRAEGVAVLTETPHELIAVHLAVTVVVHAAENNSEATDAVSTTRLQGIQNLLKNLIGRLSGDTEDGIDVGVVAAATDGEPGGELLVVELVVAVLIVLGEKSALLEFGEGTSHGLKSTSEFRELNSAESVQVEMLENLADGLAFIISSVSSLSDLLEDDILDLGETGSVNSDSGALESPNLEDALNEVALLVDGGDGVAVSVEAAESFFTDLTIDGLLAHEGDEVVHDGLSSLLSRSDTRVLRSVELANDLLNRGRRSATGNLLPGFLDDGETIIAHIILEDIDELRVGDVAVLVLIEGVEDDAELLSSEENTKLAHKFFEFELLEDAVLVAIEAQEGLSKLIHVVNTLSEELALHLVDDLVHAVSPVGHLFAFFLS